MTHAQCISNTVAESHPRRDDGRPSASAAGLLGGWNVVATATNMATRHAAASAIWRPIECATAPTLAAMGGAASAMGSAHATPPYQWPGVAGSKLEATTAADVSPAVH